MSLEGFGGGAGRLNRAGAPRTHEFGRRPVLKLAKLAHRGGSPVRPTLLPYAHQTIEPDDLAAVNAALTADWITQGPLVARFEQALAEYGGVRHAVAMASGTAALHAACWAAGLGPDDEVITTPLTFAATANAIVYRGAQTVFADIDATTLNLAPDAVKRVATARTRALLPVDFAGLPCEYGHLLPLARENGWIVIADAAHSFGGAVGERRVGALADMTTLSFHPAKLITTGEGGAVLTDRDDLADRLRAVRHHGILRGDAQRPGAPRFASRATTTDSPTSSRPSGSRSSASSTASGGGASAWAARPSSSCRRWPTGCGTAGTSSSSCCAWSVCGSPATRFSGRCARRTSGRLCTTRWSTGIGSIATASGTPLDSARTRSSSRRAW